MTTPRQARSNRGGVRTYAWPPQPPHEFEVLSVTQAVKGGLPKPYLEGWAAKMTATDAVKKHDVVGRLIEAGDEKAAIDLLKGARYRDMGSKADRGTIVHAAFEAYLADKPLDQDEVKARLEEAQVPHGMWRSTWEMINGLLLFLHDEEPEVIWSEATVYSRTHGYAGTTDLVARMRVGDEVVPVILDVKTSKDIYNDTAYQLTAYARADFVGLDDGTEVPLLGPDAPHEAGPPQYGVVVRPTASGKYHKKVAVLTDALFDRFLAMLTVARLAGIEDEVWRP